MHDPLNTFPSIVGQEHSKHLLLRAIRTGRLAHAYLFVGPEGSGKLPLALELARVLSCEQGAELGAQGHCQCRSCIQMRQVAKVRHPNLRLMFPISTSEKAKEKSEVPKERGEAAKEKIDAMEALYSEIVTALETDPYAEVKFAGSGQIQIHQVRELLNIMSLSPDLPGVRVVVIFPADRMNPNAANAFLKLLEEPPDQCLLVLIAESTRDLLPTIVSRCQQVHFAPLSVAQVCVGLTSRGVDAGKAARIAPLANGSLTRALQLVGEKTEELTQECLEFLRAAVVGNVHKANEWIDLWTREDYNRAELQEKLDFIGLWVRDALIIKAFGDSGDDKLQMPGGRQAAERIAARYGVSQLEKTLFELEETKLALQSNALPAMALTSLAIRVHRVLS